MKLLCVQTSSQVDYTIIGRAKKLKPLRFSNAPSLNFAGITDDRCDDDPRQNLKQCKNPSKFGGGNITASSSVD